jgi:NAD(P)-dependent dehydrogenase (short-subunit alcohol dehydrogenase family)
MYHMSANPIQNSGFRGSIVLVASTSGYFGGTAVVSYVASKHGVIGLLRASTKAADDLHVRLNAVAPSHTPTFITKGYADDWQASGLPTNSANGVASSIAHVALDSTLNSCCPLVSRSCKLRVAATYTDVLRLSAMR